MKSALWRTALIDENAASKIASAHEIPIRVAKWLCVREIPEQAVQDWLNPSDDGWGSPYVFEDMQAAVERTMLAISNPEKIVIVGDYDVDGVTSSTIISTTLHHLGIHHVCILPHRIHDGYGLSTSIVDRAKEVGGQLIITVDNGIRAAEAIQYATTLGMEVIVTDHHEPDIEFPADAHSVVHWGKSSSSDAVLLSGAGVAWKFATALLDAFEQRYAQPVSSEGLREWHIGLAVLGALADVMQMRGENRKLVQTGLDMLRRCQRPGWLALCASAGVNQQKLSETALLWSITPRLNAAGRMDTADIALQLLMAESDADALRYAAKIEQLNDLRRSETDRAYQEAVAQCEKRFAGSIPHSVVAYGSWPLGVVGIVAAKLSELYQSPAIVLSDDGGELLRGSGRAPEGFSLLDAVTACAEYLEHFGGHASAIGCGVHRDFLKPLIEAFEGVVSRTRGDEAADTVECLADDYLSLADVSMEFWSWVNKFSPHGPSNPPLSFYLGPIEVVSVTPMGNGKHLRLKVREGSTVSDLVWFQAPPYAFEFEEGTSICAVVFVEVNTWQGTTKVQLRVESAYRLHEPLRREDFTYFYRLLKTRRKIRTADAQKEFAHRTEQHVQVILDTFVELGFAHFDESAYHVNEQVQHHDLRESSSYQIHLRSVIGGP